MRTAFSLPAGRTAKSYVASGAGLGRGLGTAGYGGLTRKDPPEIETAAGRATAGRVVLIAIPKSILLKQQHDLLIKGYVQILFPQNIHFKYNCN